MGDALTEPLYTLRLARDEEDLAAAQSLRYEVFVEELGGDGALVDHASRREADRFDEFADHLLLRDERRGEAGSVVGVYRLLRDEQACLAGGFYTENEYDLHPLRVTGRRLLELGRSCLHPDYRGGMAMFHLWQGLSRYVDRHQTEVLFGVASFHGTDPASLAAPLSLLHQRHLAPPELRVRSRDPFDVELMAPASIDRPATMRSTPALIKAYLRLGGFVGDGAFADHAFNTTDVCMILDTRNLSARASAVYGRPSR